MKYVIFSKFAFLGLLLACQSNVPATSARPVSSADLDAAECLSAPQSKSVLSLQPEPCSYPQVLNLNGVERSVDFEGLRSLIAKMSYDAAKANNAPICIEGCEFTFYASFVPKLKAFLQSRAYERAKSCQKLDSGSIGCSTGPDDWTDRGWAYFMRDLLSELSKENAPILDGDDISLDKIKAHLSE